MSAKSKRNAKIVALYVAGEGGPSIARKLGISKQRVYAILQRDGAPRYGHSRRKRKT